MDTPINLPLELYKAQAALSLQTLGLLQAGRQRWFELGADLLADDIAQTRTALTELQGVEDWHTLATLLPNAYWRASQRWVSVLQGVLQTAIANQSGFASESQRAVLEWQQASVQALSAARNAMPVHTLLEGMLSSLGAPTDVLASHAAATPTQAPARKKGNGEMITAAS